MKGVTLAKGEHLTRLAELLAVEREEGETDEELRERCREVVLTISEPT